jgi:signal transduction histidine kinase/CheY-like chemotaxis protein
MMFVRMTKPATKILLNTSEQDDRRKAKRWTSALNIGLSAALAGAILFAVFVALVNRQYLLSAGAVLLVGTTLITGSAFYAWNRETAQRVMRLMRNIRSAEQARDQAAADMVEKARMLATMSHEIRTPLNGVIGMLNLLLHTELSAEQRNYTKTAQVSGRTLLSIIDEILDMSKAEAQRHETPQPVEITSVIESVTELLAPRAHVKNVELSAHVAADIPEQVTIDDLKLRQILFNVAGNAIKFTSSGGVDIRLSRQNTALMIRITDTGIGMSEEEVEKLFTEFAQANTSIQKDFGGTGLGLAITKRVVEQMNGTIMLESHKGEGTTFTIVLPNLLPLGVTPAPKPLQDRHFALALKPGVNTEHLKLSLIELGAVVRDLAPSEMKHFLAGNAAETVVIGDATHAVSLRAWARALRKNSRNHHQIWVMLTAEERATHQDLMSGAVAGYLLKPLRRSSLLTQLTAFDDAMVSNAVTQLRDIGSAKKQLRALSILVADDNPVNMLLLTTMLVKAGHQVQEVDHGVEALRRLVGEHNYDLAIVDVRMPGLSGLEVTKRLRAHEAEWGARRTPVLALTANARTQDREACLKAGMDAHLAKPFDQHDLMEAVVKLTIARAA